jgi:hypothetical protein
LITTASTAAPTAAAYQSSSIHKERGRYYRGRLTIDQRHLKPKKHPSDQPTTIGKKKIEKNGGKLHLLLEYLVLKLLELLKLRNLDLLLEHLRVVGRI